MVASSLALILETTHWTVVRPWKECDFYFFFSLPLIPILLHWKIANSVRFSTQLSLEECTVSEPRRLVGFLFPSAFYSHLGFYLYILLFSILTPLPAAASSEMDAGGRTSHILLWTPGQAPQWRTQLLWAAYIHCWRDILHETCHCSDINIFFFLEWIMDYYLLWKVRMCVRVRACVQITLCVQLPVNVPKASLGALWRPSAFWARPSSSALQWWQEHALRSVEISVSVGVLVTATLRVMSSSAA